MLLLLWISVLFVLVIYCESETMTLERKEKGCFYLLLLFFVLCLMFGFLSRILVMALGSGDGTWANLSTCYNWVERKEERFV